MPTENNWPLSTSRGVANSPIRELKAPELSDGRKDGMFSALRKRARALKSELVALYYAARDPRTPWYARLVMLITLAYAASPIDLIPDFIPVIGYLDDLLLVPAGIALSIRLVPADVLLEARHRAATTPVSKRANWVVGLLILVLWTLLLLFIGRYAWVWWHTRGTQ